MEQFVSEEVKLLFLNEMMDFLAPYGDEDSKNRKAFEIIESALYSLTDSHPMIDEFWFRWYHYFQTPTNRTWKLDEVPDEIRELVASSNYLRLCDVSIMLYCQLTDEHSTIESIEKAKKLAEVAIEYGIEDVYKH